MKNQPSWRKPVGIFIILGLITVWAILVASMSGSIGAQPMLVQAIIYVIAGMVWILPLRPLMIWMETGSFRAPDSRADFRA